MSLQIYDARERALVAAADTGLRLASDLARPFRRRERARSPSRILVLRLERIGDLLMALPALRDLRCCAESAEIDLAVGEWNLSLARAIPFVTRVEPLSARWLARGGEGRTLGGLLLAARRWRKRRYDLAINLEPDIRSNLVLAASGARWCAGWSTGGGGPLLDLGLEFDPCAHTSANARRLISAIFERSAPARPGPLLQIPERAARAADATLGSRAKGPLVGVHASGGRHVKQWEPQKFAEVASRLVRELNATIVLTGGSADRPLVDVVRAALPPSAVIDASDRQDLIDLAALIQRLHLLVTGDTGPMHLAAAVGTPVVAIFGASDPNRYAPSGPADRIVLVDLPCRPCNRIRLPPRRCADRTPDCLAGLSATRVFDAAISSLEASARPRASAAGQTPA
jgi:lipopolysaccharide heptosyltransferase II